MLYLPLKIQNVIDTLNAHGFEAYAVGGCVRDMLLGQQPHDFDIATSAKPEQIIPLFEKTVPTGIKHGTVTVILEGEPIEVTTFRSDGVYSDCRRPDSVNFVTNLKEDLSRRDFTVNALAYNSQSGLKDYFNGERDLESRTLCAVGNAELRFKEDALRILRLFRFSSVLDFNIEAETLNAAVSCRHLLKNISSERIFKELSKAVCGINPAAMKPLTECGGLDFLGITKSPDYSKIRPLRNNPELALFAFFYLSEADTERTLDILKASNRTKKFCRDLNLLLKMPFPEDKPRLKEMLNLTNKEAVKNYLLFQTAVAGIETEKAENLLNEILNCSEPYKISDLQISGSDLKKIGFKGKAVGEILEKLRKAAVNDPQLNTKNKLFEIAEKLFRN